jgi:ParB-like chromosome segregation protein Spo0J
MNVPVATSTATTTTTMGYHQLAELFPLMEGEEFEALVGDIRRHGLREPVILHRDQILDGRNRYRACLEAGVQCRFELYDGSDPAAYVVSLNLKRRHLDESQRAMVAARLATLGDGQRADLGQGLPIGRASELLNVGERSVARASEVQRSGVAELQRAVERGQVSVSAAADVAGESIERQQEIVAKGEDEILRAAKEIRARKAAERHAERTQRLVQIAEGNIALPTDKRYPVIYADPPWYFEAYHSVSGTGRTAESHYPCMSTDDIAALPVVHLATNSTVLFMWATAPHLPEALRIIEGWGFRYTTHACWVKDQIGLGFYLRNQHEPLLIARWRVAVW